MQTEIKHSSRTWRIPIALSVLTAFGLLAALLGTGIWQWAAWVTMGAPVAVALGFSFFSHR
jgi:hypothetical protein